MRSREFYTDLGHLKYKKSVLEPKTLVSTWFVNLANKAKRVFSFESASQKEKKNNPMIAKATLPVLIRKFQTMHHN